MKPIVPKKYRRIYEGNARNRILELLIKYSGQEFSLSDIAKESGVAKANVGKILKGFSQLNIIKITKLSKIWRISANRENLDFQRSKIIYGLNFIYQSGLVEFLNDYFHNPKSIVLFGSFRYGLDTSNSDIDIAIETDMDNDEEGNPINIYRIAELRDFEKEINRKINIHAFSEKEIDKNLFNNLVNGITLSGFLEVIK